jgi:hypothetical protein
MKRLRESMEEARVRETPDNLKEYVELLPSKSAARYAEVFRVHYHRDLVLASRYGDRFRGASDRLDIAVGDYLCLSKDTVRKLRQLIRHRLCPVPPQR